MTRYIILMTFKVNLELFEKQVCIIVKIVLKWYMNIVNMTKNAIIVKSLLGIISSLTFTFMRCPEILMAR